MNNQEVFDIVWERAKDKRKAFSNENEFCKYRNEEGVACFVGVCIPDDTYNEDMEGHDFHNLIARFPVIKDIFKDCDSSFVKSLQVIHDSNEPKEWEELLRRKAVEQNLTVPA